MSLCWFPAESSASLCRGGQGTSPQSSHPALQAPPLNGRTQPRITTSEESF